MIDNLSIEGLNERIDNLELKLYGSMKLNEDDIRINNNPTVQSSSSINSYDDNAISVQLQHKLKSFKKFLSDNDNLNKTIEKFLLNTEKLGLLNGLPVQTNIPISNKLINDKENQVKENEIENQVISTDDNLSLDQKKQIVSVNLNSIEQCLNSIDEIILILEGFEKFQIDKNDIFLKLLSVDNSYKLNILENLKIIKNSYSNLIIKSINIFEKNSKFMIDQNEFLLSIETKLFNIEKSINIRNKEKEKEKEKGN
ncbi:hypothetical protein B5S31_g4622 [[Candida] boidinii]|uniref:Unnamed protein product n=1 Tax=Candida boidinii TaxID=5477 RepID=A0ACB5TM43_CANBO|nr:hypothetical protein B5S29_g3607 [[Candida] boidinii]OWB74798.1 hypothetical protein B5S31_g4622 [[Candida] boidinii]OWB79429.1 hypothetical protein B5S32_g3651 [[Candida] boidinii]GME90790.1 unnamed protein product [[Candida] boidinii]